MSYLRRYTAFFIGICFTALLLSSCGGGGNTRPTASAPPAHQSILLLIEQGPAQAQQAAQQLEQLAATSKKDRPALLTDAAFAWYAAGDIQRAQTLLSQVQAKRVTGDSKIRFNLVTAELRLAAKQPGEALNILGASPVGVPTMHLGQWHLIRANALFATQQPLVLVATERAMAHNFLQGELRQQNEVEISRVLARLDNPLLQQQAISLALGNPLYNFVGNELLLRGLTPPRPLERKIIWQTQFNKTKAADKDGYRPPNKVAVLLPLTGEIAAAAAPVRDGLLAAYYSENRARPEIVFFDTKGTGQGTLNAYQMAKNANADFVIGPLGRDEVAALLNQSDLPITTLLLNRVNQEPPAGHVMFSLSPEEEGVMAAEFLLQRNHRQALIIAANDDNNSRSSNAFKERFELRGGSIVNAISVSDGSSSISALLEQSNAANAVFIAAKNPLARAIANQLNQSSFSGKPRVATSQIMSNSGSAEQNRVLDGIVFSSEVWPNQNPGIFSLNSSTLPNTARGGAARLFAFGADAWKIAAYLDRLALIREGKLAGATGTLQLDLFGNIIRSPQWTTFSSGNAVPFR